MRAHPFKPLTFAANYTFYVPKAQNPEAFGDQLLSLTINPQGAMREGVLDYYRAQARDDMGDYLGTYYGVACAPQSEVGRNILKLGLKTPGIGFLPDEHPESYDWKGLKAQIQKMAQQWIESLLEDGKDKSARTLQ